MEIRENKRTGERNILLNDEDIRPVLFEYFEIGEPRLRFFEELVIGKSRADALLVQEEITGFEIKSDVDSFLRLPKQVKNYDRFCNKAYLVVGERHVKEAAEHIPDFWGIYLVGAHFKDDSDSRGEQSDNGSVAHEMESMDGARLAGRTENGEPIEFTITCIRKAKENPRIYLKTQMRLLWRSELIRIVKRHNLGGVTRRNKRELVALIIDSLGKEGTLSELCNELIDRDYTIFETSVKQEAKAKPKKAKPKKAKPKKAKTTKEKPTPPSIVKGENTNKTAPKK